MLSLACVRSNGRGLSLFRRGYMENPRQALVELQTMDKRQALMFIFLLCIPL